MLKAVKILNKYQTEEFLYAGTSAGAAAASDIQWMLPVQRGAVSWISDAAYRPARGEWIRT